MLNRILLLTGIIADWGVTSVFCLLITSLGRYSCCTYEVLTFFSTAATPDWMYEGSPAHNWLDRPIPEKEIETGARKWWPNHQHQSVQGLDFEGAPLGPPAHQPGVQAQPQQRWWGADPSLGHLSGPHSLAGTYPSGVRQHHQVGFLLEIDYPLSFSQLFRNCSRNEVCAFVKS